MNVAAVPESREETATAHDPQPTTVGQRSLLRSLLAFVGASFLWMQFGLVAIAVICSVAAGQRPIVITGGSMSPAVSRGDVIVIKDVDPATLKQNQLVTFDIGEGRVTHRIIDFTDDGAVVTKGDANAIADTMSVPRDRIIGRAQVIIPSLGLPVVWLQHQEWSKLGLWLALTTLALVAVFGGNARPSRRQRRAALVEASEASEASEDTDLDEDAVSLATEGARTDSSAEVHADRVDPVTTRRVTAPTNCRPAERSVSRPSSAGGHRLASAAAIARAGAVSQRQSTGRRAKPVAIAAARRRPSIMVRVPRQGKSPAHRRTYIDRPTGNRGSFSGATLRLVPPLSVSPEDQTTPTARRVGHLAFDPPTGLPLPYAAAEASAWSQTG